MEVSRRAISLYETLRHGHRSRLNTAYPFPLDRVKSNSSGTLANPHRQRPEGPFPLGARRRGRHTWPVPRQRGIAVVPLSSYRDEPLEGLAQGSLVFWCFRQDGIPFTQLGVRYSSRLFLF
jgi:hypothetical protein